MGKMKAEMQGLAEKVEKLAEENGKMKAAKDEEKTKFEELKAAMAKIKEEFDKKNVEFDQKADKEMLANLCGRIDRMELIQLNKNKWNAADCGPKLDILEGGLAVDHSGKNEWSSIRSILPIPPFNLNATEPSIAGYYEVQIIRKEWFGDIQIGFCTHQFSLKNIWLGEEENSIGIFCKYEMRIDGESKGFVNTGEYFQVGDVIGVGIIHSPANKSLKCFATCNGRLLGTIELPDHFSSLQLFPAATLLDKGNSFRANFGQQKWRFNPSQLLQ